MRRIIVVGLLGLLAASSCSRECQAFSRASFSYSLQTNKPARLALATSPGELRVSGTAPEGMTLVSDGGTVELAGTPTSVGDFSFTITPTTASCLAPQESADGVDQVTESNVVVTVSGPECDASEPPEPFYACLGAACGRSFAVCNEVGAATSISIPPRSFVKLSFKGDGRSRITVEQYSAWFDSTFDELTPDTSKVFEVTPADGETFDGWFFTPDTYDLDFVPASVVRIASADPKHASSGQVGIQYTTFARGGSAITSAGTNSGFQFASPNLLLIDDVRQTRAFEFDFADAPMAWQQDVVGGCEHPAMTGAQDYAFLADLEVGLWSVSRQAVYPYAQQSYDVTVRDADGDVLTEGSTFRVTEPQRVSVRVTPRGADGGVIAYSNTCAFDGGQPPNVNWGELQRLQLELLSPDAGL